MRSNNYHLHLIDVGRSYSNLQLPSLQQLKIASRIFLPFPFIFPLVLFSIYTNFIHNLPPPTLIQLYENYIPSQFYITVASIVYIFWLIRPTLTWFLGYSVQGINCLPILFQNCTPVQILTASQAKSGSPHHLHLIREVCKYIYNRTRTFPLSHATVTHFVPFKPSTASCMSKITFVILVYTNDVLLT